MTVSFLCPVLEGAHIIVNHSLSYFIGQNTITCSHRIENEAWKYSLDVFSEDDNTVGWIANWFLSRSKTCIIWPLFLQHRLTVSTSVALLQAFLSLNRLYTRPNLTSGIGPLTHFLYHPSFIFCIWAQAVFA